MPKLLEQEVEQYIDQVNSREIRPCPEREYNLMQACEEYNRVDLKDKLIAHMREQVEMVSAKILNGDYDS